MDHWGPLLYMPTHTAIPATEAQTALVLVIQDSRWRIFILTANVNIESKRGLALPVNMFLLAEIMCYLTNPFVLTCHPGEVPQPPPHITPGRDRLASLCYLWLCWSLWTRSIGYIRWKAPGSKGNQGSNRHARIWHGPSLSREVRSYLLFADFSGWASSRNYCLALSLL